MLNISLNSWKASFLGSGSSSGSVSASWRSTSRRKDSRSVHSFTMPLTSTWAPMWYRTSPLLSRSGEIIKRFMNGEPSRRLAAGAGGRRQPQPLRRRKVSIRV